MSYRHDSKLSLGTGPGTRTPNQLIKSSLGSQLLLSQSVRWLH